MKRQRSETAGRRGSREWETGGDSLGGLCGVGILGVGLQAPSWGDRPVPICVRRRVRLHCELAPCIHLVQPARPPAWEIQQRAGQRRSARLTLCLKKMASVGSGQCAPS